MKAVYYQVWLDGAPYLRGQKFTDSSTAFVLYDRVAGRISAREARNRLAVYVVDESGRAPEIHPVPDRRRQS